MSKAFKYPEILGLVRVLIASAKKNSVISTREYRLRKFKDDLNAETRICFGKREG
jgi:hypothetical protein